MKLELDLNEDEMAVVADALNEGRRTITAEERDGLSSFRWLPIQESVERKFRAAGLVGFLDGLDPPRGGEK